MSTCPLIKAIFCHLRRQTSSHRFIMAEEKLYAYSLASSKNRLALCRPLYLCSHVDKRCCSCAGLSVSLLQQMSLHDSFVLLNNFIIILIALIPCQLVIWHEGTTLQQCVVCNTMLLLASIIKYQINRTTHVVPKKIPRYDDN